MTYVPFLKCKYCGESRQAQVNGDQGIVREICGCKESREAWEREHRAKMERRKRAKRGLR